MKRLLAISLVALVSFGVLAGCAPKEEAPAETPGAAEAQKGGGATMDTSTK